MFPVKVVSVKMFFFAFPWLVFLLVVDLYILMHLQIMDSDLQVTSETLSFCKADRSESL